MLREKVMYPIMKQISQKDYSLHLKIPQYPNIDMEKTGKRIQRLSQECGWSVREIQEYLCLSCPQPVYRWFKGQILPSVNHLYALSRLFGVHMEELLVARSESQVSVSEVKEEWLVISAEPEETPEWKFFAVRGDELSAKAPVVCDQAVRRYMEYARRLPKLYRAV